MIRTCRTFVRTFVLALSDTAVTVGCVTCVSGSHLAVAFRKSWEAGTQGGGCGRNREEGLGACTTVLAVGVARSVQILDRF